MDSLILMTGNPLDGFRCYGPFDQVEDAQAYAERHQLDGADWWVVPCYSFDPRPTTETTTKSGCP